MLSVKYILLMNKKIDYTDIIHRFSFDTIYHYNNNKPVNIPTNSSTNLSTNSKLILLKTGERVGILESNDDIRLPNESQIECVWESDPNIIGHIIVIFKGNANNIIIRNIVTSDFYKSLYQNSDSDIHDLIRKINNVAVR